MNDPTSYSFLLPASSAALSSLLLFVRKDRTAQQVWLAHAFLATSACLTLLYLYQNHILSSSPAVDLLTVLLSLSSAPCYFIYVVSQTSPSGLKAVHFLVFVPAILMVALNFLADAMLGWDGVRAFLEMQHHSWIPDEVGGAELFKTVVDSNLLRGATFIMTVSVFVHAHFAFRPRFK